MATVLSGKFAEYTLEFDRPTGQKLTDAAGKEYYQTKVVKLRAYLKTPRKPDVRAQIGVDVVLVRYEGRLTNPGVPPDDFVTGTLVRFKMGGRQITGRVVVFAPPLVKGLDQKVGRSIQVVGSG